MVEVLHLTKTYGVDHVLSDVSFSQKSGETVGLLGARGAGKTTLMDIMTGSLPMDAGAVRLHGHDLGSTPVPAKRHLGYLPQTHSLYPDMTSSEYLTFVYALKGVSSPDRNAHIRRAQEEAGIQERSGGLIGRLPAEQKRRLALAAALIGDPDILLLDQPTEGLMPEQAEDLLRCISALGASHTILMSSRHPSEIRAVCRRVLVLSEGVLVRDDSVGSLTVPSVAGRGFVVRVSGARETVLPLLSGCAGIRDVTSLSESEPGAMDYQIAPEDGADPRPALMGHLAEAGCPILKLEPFGLSLEEAFARLNTPVDALFARTTSHEPAEEGGDAAC